MKFRRKYRYYVGDFETTVYSGQTTTEVWASAIVELMSDDVTILHSIQETWDYLKSLNDNVIIYYHNLKFDGHFWLDFFLRQPELELAYEGNEENGTFDMLGIDDMPDNTYIYNISGMGQWYLIRLKINDHIIEFRDSLKLLPFSVSAIGDSFGTQHKKLTMNYEGYRYAGCEITDEEKHYIANDVLVVKEALEIMFAQGHKKLTIGACCLDEYKNHVFKDKNPLIDYVPHQWEEAFPDLTQYTLDKNIWGSSTIEEYIRKSYHGGWCYLVEQKANKVKHNGITLDVNSLYPSMMSSESGNVYPYGLPEMRKIMASHSMRGKITVAPNEYYFVRFKCKFSLKRNKLPTVQIKNNKMYKSTEWLWTSDVLAPDGKYYDLYRTPDGVLHDTDIEMTMTQTDYETFLKHYDVKDLWLLDCAVFKATTGLFDTYIDKYKKIKTESKGAKRTLAKLYLNNLYGKMATTPINRIKLAYLNEDDIMCFKTIRCPDKDPVYIPVGSAITSYARNFTIKAAQANYYGAFESGFIYADTDSIHCDLPIEKIKGVDIHDTDFCKWKHESSWDKAIFVRQKTYIEHVIEGDEKHNDIKCAGMPQVCKDKIDNKLENGTMKYSDFKTGLEVDGKLLPKRIKGGIVLTPTTYVIR